MSMEIMNVKEVGNYKRGMTRQEGNRYVRLIGFHKEDGKVWLHWQYLLKKTMKPSGKSASFLEKMEDRERIRIDAMRQSFRQFPSYAKKEMAEDGTAFLGNCVYQTYPCGCTITGNGTLPDPLAIKYCHTHTVAPQAAKWAETAKFFQDLIDKTDTYFLSDYVEDVKEEEGITEEEVNAIIQKRDQLKTECEAHGIDIHYISQVVADKFLNKTTGVTL